ncbi:hypothetical protein CLV34_2371 [Luteimicrobium subarcticum]|uniref:Uncharacterized protein n=1 Tax=Luteimicrobium subarcticum TaxID=620910 RepID=A0A2M8WJJ5_9MICO|nr:hypothetical protein CLV34_2371 [Luteimicrobium subarcticum]
MTRCRRDRLRWSVPSGASDGVGSLAVRGSADAVLSSSVVRGVGGGGRDAQRPWTVRDSLAPSAGVGRPDALGSVENGADAAITHRRRVSMGTEDETKGGVGALVDKGAEQAKKYNH